MAATGDSSSQEARPLFPLCNLNSLFKSEKLSDSVLVFVPRHHEKEAGASAEAGLTKDSEDARASEPPAKRPREGPAATELACAQDQRDTAADATVGGAEDASGPGLERNGQDQAKDTEKEQEGGEVSGQQQQQQQVVSSQQEQQPKPLTWPPGSLVLPAHKLVLFAGSHYWKARITNAGSMAGDAHIEPGSGRAVLVEREMGPEEMEVAEVLVRFLYTGQLQGPGGEGGLSAGKLIVVYRLAQRFDVPCCREACIAAITALPPEQLSPSDINILLDQLQDAGMQEQQQVQRLCKKWLVQLFGDVNRLLNTSELWEQFGKLSLPAVLLWAGSDQLQVVASENDVAEALSNWYSKQPEGSLSPAQQKQLSACVRVKQLTRGYRLKLLKKDWLLPRDPLFSLVAVLDSKQATPWSKGEEDLVSELGIPPAWVAGPRAWLPEAEAEARRTLEFAVTRQQLEEARQKMLGGTKGSVDSSTLTSEGHAFKLQMIMSNTARGAQIGLYMSQAASKGSIPAYAKYDLGYQQLDQGLRRAAGVGPAAEALGPAVWKAGGLVECHASSRTGRGFSNLFLGNPTFSSVEELAAQGYLVEGALRLRSRLLAVD